VVEKKKMDLGDLASAKDKLKKKPQPNDYTMDASKNLVALNSALEKGVNLTNVPDDKKSIRDKPILVTEEDEKKAE